MSDVRHLSVDGEDFKVGHISSVEAFQSLYLWVLKEFRTDAAMVSNFLGKIRAGDPAALGGAVVSVGLGAWLIYLVYCQLSETENKPPVARSSKPQIVPRDFTVDQLQEFNGLDGKPIYIGLNGEVFDVSDATEYYGVGAPYRCFAGRNATRAMAKFSFEEQELSNNDVSDLSPFERNTLDDWYQKFKYFKGYPVVGKYSFPPQDLALTVDELLAFNGTKDCAGDRVHSSIFIVLKTKIFDVSYGGFEMYGPDGPYARFSGRDVSRALAKMSFEESDINSSNIDDLTVEQQKVLADWINKFENVKKYPIVGHLAIQT